MNRRSIDSEYMRKKRISRRPRDNWRKSKGKTTMTTDKNLWATITVLTIIWLTVTGWSLWNAFK